jgi:Protein of unknown function (DUF1551).
MFKKFSMLTLLSCCTAIVALQPTQAQAYNDPCCYDPCGSCCDRFWVSADYLYWEIQDSKESVPLVVSGPVVQEGAPILGLPGTQVVLGCDNLKNDWRSGGRFSIGYWFDDCKCWGAELNYFFLPNKSRSKTVFSDGSANSEFLAIPLFDEATNSEISYALARPGFWSGTASLRYKNNMQGAELNVLKTIPSCDCNMSFGLLAGFRYLNFDEHLSFDTSSPNVAPFPEDTYTTTDKFHTENNYYGGQIGGKFEYNYCNFNFNATAKVALGALCQEAVIAGNTISNYPIGNSIAAVTTPGGYFTSAANIGNHKKTEFSVLPEIDVNLGYQITDCLRLQVGYSFLYVSNVMRAGKLIDRKINTAATPVETDYKTNKDGLWAQGVNAGIEFRF